MNTKKATMLLPAEIGTTGCRAATQTFQCDHGTAYEEGENFVAVIDGFLVSPNVEVLKVSGRDLVFENSDHNPVSAVFVLK